MNSSRSRGLRSRASKALLAVTLAMYALSTFDWVLDIHFLRNQLYVYLPGELSSPPRNVDGRMKVDAALKIAQSITNNICVCNRLTLGDVSANMIDASYESRFS